MAHVIGEACLGEVYAACVDVCPVECIHPGQYKSEAMMIIDPEVCIDCGVCLPECPIGAIVGSVDENPEWAKVNAELTRLRAARPADGHISVLGSAVAAMAWLSEHAGPGTQQERPLGPHGTSQRGTGPVKCR